MPANQKLKPNHSNKPLLLLMNLGGILTIGGKCFFLFHCNSFVKCICQEWSCFMPLSSFWRYFWAPEKTFPVFRNIYALDFLYIIIDEFLLWLLPQLKHICQTLLDSPEGAAGHTDRRSLAWLSFVSRGSNAKPNYSLWMWV